MKIETRLTFDKVKFNQENDAHLVVSMNAPKIDWQSKRPPVAIIASVDVSGSMLGDKIDYVKQSLLRLVDHLLPGDCFGLVTFTSDIKVVQVPVKMDDTSKQTTKTEIGKLAAQQDTNLSGGMIAALEQANKLDVPAGTIVRVIMFTDGLANMGVATSRPDILALLDRMLGDVSISAFGYGTDADQDLLADLAKRGKGNYAFIRNPEDALTAFAKELGGLLSTYAQNIVVDVAPYNGHEIIEVVSDVDAEESGKKAKITLPDILSEETRHLVLKLRLSKQTQALPRAVNVADVKIEYDLIDEKGNKQHRTEELKAKIRFVKPGDEQVKPTTGVDAIVAGQELVKKQIEAEGAAQAGNYALAASSMSLFSADLNARGFAGLASSADRIGASVGSPFAYNISSGYRNSMKTGLTRGASLKFSDAEAEEELKTAGVVFDNSATKSLAEAFTAGTVVANPPPAPTTTVQPSTSQVVVSSPPTKEPPRGFAKKRSKRW